MRSVRGMGHAVFAAIDVVLPRRGGPRILIYHQVGSGRPHEMSLSVDAFRRQLEWLQSSHDVVPLETMLARRGEASADRLVAITFDDGYADVYASAFPLLRDRRLPFTLYVTTGPIETPKNFLDWPGEPLSWDQIREMYDSGLMTVGAHTHTHPDLRSVDESAARDEIETSNRLIEQRLGVPARHFTYTKGWWSPTADPVVRQAYESATLGMGAAITAATDPYLLNRTAVNQSEPLWVWKRKLRTGGPTEDRVRRKLHGYRGP